MKKMILTAAVLASIAGPASTGTAAVYLEGYDVAPTTTTTTTPTPTVVAPTAAPIPRVAPTATVAPIVAPTATLAPAAPIADGPGLQILPKPAVAENATATVLAPTATPTRSVSLLESSLVAVKSFYTSATEFITGW